MIIRAAGLLVLVLLIATQAEDQVRSTQEELRRRKIYFGDIDGRRSDEFEEALKRYQRRKGFAASGREDPATLRSLGLLARSPDEAPPKELEWPQEPVLKSDERLDVAAEATELAAVTGIAPDSVAPESTELEPIASGRSRGSRGAQGRSGGASGRASGRGGASGGGAASAGGRESGRGEGGERGQRSVTPSEMVQFVKRYVAAVDDGDLEDELAMYADRVDYYHNGSVDRRVIEHSLRKYYALWPKRSYSLARVVAYSVSPKRGEITITYNVDFSLRGEKGRVKGTTQNRIVINAATSSPRIVAIRESRVRQ